MCSPIRLLGPDTCCICFEHITAGGHAVDRNGDYWDVHTGQCAEKAGIEQ